MTASTSATDFRRWSLPRRFVTATAAVLAAVVWTHSLAGVLRRLGPEEASLAALPLTLAAALVALAGSPAWPRRGAALAGGAAGAAGYGLLAILVPGSWAAGLALVPVGAAVTAGGGWLGRRLPAGLDRVLHRHRGVALLWGLLALVAVVQMGRLATYMTDPASDWFLSTRHPFWARHECLPAYFQGAELALAGEEDLYDPAHYPGLNPDAAPTTALTGMSPEDPYQYPPQFLLLPRLAMLFSHHYPTLRLAWFGLQVSLFAAVAAWLALWVGGRPGRVALWLLPLALVAFPTLHNFQFGQFHLATVALAVAAFLCFEHGRRALGGGLMAAAVLAKMFPAVLLLPLLARRRFRELAWTAAFGLLFTALALAVLGPAPFTAFFQHHLPRLGNGTAFAFDEAWPELAELVIADNQGVFGLVVKLGALGLPGMDKGTAAWAGRLFTLALFALAFFSGRRLSSIPRQARAATWLGLLGLASLASPGAWGDYVPVTAVWLLTLLAAGLAESRRAALLQAPVWLFQATLLGTMPIGDRAPFEVMAPLSIAGSLTLLGLFLWTVLARPEALAVAAAGAAEGTPAPAHALARAA